MKEPSPIAKLQRDLQDLAKQNEELRTVVAKLHNRVQKSEQKVKILTNAVNKTKRDVISMEQLIQRR